MKTAKLPALMIALATAGCAHSALPSPQALQSNAASTAPAILATPQVPPTIDPIALAQVEANLRALGYAAGKSADPSDPILQHAVSSFEKDQGMTEDGQLSDAVMDRLKLVRSALARTQAADANRDAVYVYSDGTPSRQPAGLLPVPPQGLSADTPTKFLQPLRPGMQASYHWGHLAKDGSFTPTNTVTCRTSKLTENGLPLGVADTIAVDCRGDGPNVSQRRALFSPKLGVVVREERVAGNRDLMAIRPFTGDWPSAARLGLDWALTDALDQPLTGTPVRWSSTAVPPHFEIRAQVALSGQRAGLSGKYAAQFCRRFELAQAGPPSVSYPGIACQDAHGTWSVPYAHMVLASPASGISTHEPMQQSAQN